MPALLIMALGSNPHHPGRARRPCGRAQPAPPQRGGDFARTRVGSMKLKRIGLLISGLVLSLSLTGVNFGAGASAADAAQNRDVDALRTLVRQRADVNAAQPDGTTALHWAAHWNDPETVTLLLRA